MHRLELVTSPDAHLRNVILDGLRAFNSGLFSRSSTPQDLAVALHGDDGILGGLWGRVAGNWLAIELIFVPETMRGQGIASALIAMAEAEAVKRGCRSAWLDTLNPQAARLYQSLGYAPFGELEDYAEGTSRFFMRKALSA